MKLSEIKGKEAIRILAALMDPVARIVGNEKVQKIAKSKVPRLVVAKTMLEECPDDVIEVMALLDGEDPKTYEVNLLSLPMKLLEIINDPEVVQLFFSEEQTEA